MSEPRIASRRLAVSDTKMAMAQVRRMIEDTFPPAGYAVFVEGAV